MHVACRYFAFTSLAFAFALMIPSTASADKSADKKECAQAYADAQKSMRSTTLRKAREQLNVCSRDVCIPAVRKDCVAWLDEVNAGIPSIVIDAKGPDGKETLDVKVSLVTPGATPASPTLEVLATKIDVKALELDPGTFTLRFERTGSPPIDQEVVLRQGQKNKQVDVSWAPATPASAAGDKKDDKGTTKSGGGSDKVDSPKQKTVLPYVLGGVGVLAAAGGVFFWLKSESQRSDLKQTCAPHCSASDADSIKTQRLVGDILAAVGVIAIGAAVVWIVTDTSGAKSNAPSGKWGRILTEGYAF